MQLKVDHLSNINQAAKKFLELTKGHTIFAFDAEMGAGKTTFINAILLEMGIKDHVSSPTFSIINEYYSSNYGAIYHFDFYRIENEMEALDIGIEDIIYDNNYCFIEWPTKIENLLPENTVVIKISIENNCRILDIQI